MFLSRCSFIFVPSSMLDTCVSSANCLYSEFSSVSSSSIATPPASSILCFSSLSTLISMTSDSWSVFLSCVCILLVISSSSDSMSMSGNTFSGTSSTIISSSSICLEGFSSIGFSFALSSITCVSFSLMFEPGTSSTTISSASSLPICLEGFSSKVCSFASSSITCVAFSLIVDSSVDASINSLLVSVMSCLLLVLSLFLSPSKPLSLFCSVFAFSASVVLL
uniref:Uncharacterized protein n=1 Tax=Cacopsylla melanoneura TaxID=428564 RepID=A0A8D9BHG3_9HEMI